MYVPHEHGVSNPEARDCFSLNECYGVAGNDVVAGLERARSQARVSQVHVLTPGKVMKQPGLVSTRMLSSSGCGEACANSTYIIAEMSAALGWNCQQP
jgi:uncharacterized metal-binding protein